ncbi:hypothetical protein DR864_28285 (plasmid) [Runella rosea]|uniref:Uncharacterized protein n=1 Tax=Runella rosea TaxID=2259595 RepID=A0A344TT05_9BACT|nr:hypothetical protein [Runella rosea]AXE21776.1 hypothetical protein DR864_28285 [Runella rosea]
MKFLQRLGIGLLVGIALCLQSQAQEYLYFNTGSGGAGKLVSANEEKVGMLLEGSKSWNTGRDRVIMAFNQVGNYLIVEDLSKDEAQALEQINSFYNEAGGSKIVNDILIKAAPFEIIACTITSDGDAINYRTTDGNSAAINRDDLLAIIKRDGSHQLLKDATEVVVNLRTNYAKFQQLRTLKKTTPEPFKPTTAPSPQTSVAQAPKPEIEAAAPSKEKKKLTPEEQKLYKARSIAKVTELTKLLNDIVDKTKSKSEKDEAIKEALKIFVPGSQMEVSSVNNPVKLASRSVEDYLTRLSKLNYPKIEITTANLAMVEDFESDDKGNHWGIVTGEQVFDAGVFRDVTKKNYKIKLQPYKKAEKENERNYQVLIGSVSVVVSQ